MKVNRRNVARQFQVDQPEWAKTTDRDEGREGKDAIEVKNVEVGAGADVDEEALE
jgi:hypothetical protein